jgi:hypothetical protein
LMQNSAAAAQRPKWSVACRSIGLPVEVALEYSISGLLAFASHIHGPLECGTSHPAGDHFSGARSAPVVKCKKSFVCSLCADQADMHFIIKVLWRV